MLKPSGIITILTDFGGDDYFLGALKGAMLKINPEAKIIDITNTIPPGDTRKAAFTLMNYYAEYPEGTVHYCVVDPGVGTGRKAIAIATDEYRFVAPDNGTVYPSIKNRGWKVYEIDSDRIAIDLRSNTFHGRDIFAPAAALLSKGIDIERLGPKVDDMVHLEMPVPVRRDDILAGEVLNIDRFGNVITNFTPIDLTGLKNPVFRVKDKLIKTKLENYQQASPDVLFYIIGSAGYVEISVKNDSAAGVLGINAGDDVIAVEGSPASGGLP
jgi:S-adenosylmethionine hydrolase